MKSTKISKVICEICYNSDEFYLCFKCFGKYSDKSYNFRNSTNLEKFSLKTLIQDILTKNYENLLKYNHKLLKIYTIERLKKKLQRLDTELINKQNIINSISLEIKKKEENLKKFKEILEQERIKLNLSMTQNNRQSEEILTKTNSQWKEKLIKLAKTIMNKSLINPIDISEYFMIQEFLKPEIIIENRKNSNLDKNFKEFDKIQNVLSFSDSTCLFNLKDHKEYDIQFEKFIKFKQSIFKNKCGILRLNSYIFSLIFAIKLLSSSLNIYLPYEIYSAEDFLILNPTAEKIYNLFLPLEASSNTNVNEIIQGYIYLDVNLKFLTNFMNEDKSVYKTYKKSKSFKHLHTKFNPDLKEFLNVEFLIEKNVLNRNFSPNSDISYFRSKCIVDVEEEGQKIEGDLCEIENENEGNTDGVNFNFGCEEYKSEVKGYIIHENYFA